MCRRGLILAIAATDRNVSIWVHSDGVVSQVPYIHLRVHISIVCQFTKAASLSGHEDWVKCLAFQSGVAGPDTLTLASGSQDGTVRLWNIERLVKKSISTSARADGSVLDDELLDNFEASFRRYCRGGRRGKANFVKAAHNYC